MNKEDFLKELERHLEGFSEEEKKEILYDYEEHFRIGFDNGKTEAELIEELGDPLSIANQYNSSSGFEKVIVSDNNAEAEPVLYAPAIETTANANPYNHKYKDPLDPERSIFPSLLAAVSLLLFNVLFVLWIFIGLGSALIGLFSGAIASFFGGIVFTLGGIFGPIFGNFFDTSLSPVLSILFGIGTTAFGILFFIGDCYLGKYFIKGTIKYLKWNLSIIRR